jgi:hypothetical protein
MKSRANTYWEYLTPFIEAHRESVESALSEAFERERDNALASLHGALRTCGNKSRMARELGRKGQTAFIVLSFLNTAFLDGSYRILIDLFDNDFYLDLSECSAYFSYAFLIHEFDRAAQILVNETCKNFKRCLDYEKSEIRWKYKGVLFEKIKEILFLLFFDDATAPILKEMNLKENTTIMYGYYFNYQTPYYQIN